MLYKSGVYARKVLGLTPGDLSARQQEFMRKKPDRSYRPTKDRAQPELPTDASPTRRHEQGNNS
jgi:hypothetical protein